MDGDPVGWWIPRLPAALFASSLTFTLFCLLRAYRAWREWGLHRRSRCNRP